MDVWQFKSHLNVFTVSSSLVPLLYCDVFSGYLNWPQTAFALQMLIAQCNGYRILKQSAFTLFLDKPHHHATVLFATRHVVTWEQEGYLAIHFYYRLMIEYTHVLYWCFATVRNMVSPSDLTKFKQTQTLSDCFFWLA